MKLILYREDLREEERNRNCSLTRFEHFTDEAQNAIRVVGSATFREHDHSSHNVIVPPRQERQLDGNR